MIDREPVRLLVEDATAADVARACQAIRDIGRIPVLVVESVDGRLCDLTIPSLEMHTIRVKELI